MLRPKTPGTLINCFRDVRYSCLWILCKWGLWNVVLGRLLLPTHTLTPRRAAPAGRQHASEYPQADWQLVSQSRPWPRCHGTPLSSATSVLLGVATITTALVIPFKLNVVKITHDFPNNKNTPILVYSFKSQLLHILSSVLVSARLIKQA